MTHKTFNAEFFRAFPAFKVVADELYHYMGDEEPSSYLVFEGVLVPEIERAAASNPANLSELMTFVEQVAQPGFGNCDDLVQIGLGEWLPSSRHSDQIRAAAGPYTAEAIWRAERSRVNAERQMNASPLATFARKLFTPKRNA